MIFLIAAIMFLNANDPLLNETAPQMCACRIPHKSTREAIDQMLEVAAKEGFLVGLAAPQIGILQRIILIDKNATGVAGTLHEPNLQVYINPEILWRSDEISYWREGCFSVQEMCGVVPRSEEVVIRAYDRKGQIFTETLTGYTARIAQHEIDHLDGVRFPDRIANDADLHFVTKADFPRYRKEWENWPHKATRQQWELMKHAP